MAHGFACLLLLHPVEDIADGEDTRVVEQLKCRLDLDEATLRQNARAERVDNLTVRAGSKRRDLRLRQRTSLRR